MNLKGALFLLATTTFTVTGQLLMKRGVEQGHAASISAWISSPWLQLGGLCYVSGFVLWLKVLKLLPLSIAYPASSIAYVMVIFASAIFLGEPVNLFKLAGIACICAGVVFIGLA